MKPSSRKEENFPRKETAYEQQVHFLSQNLGLGVGGSQASITGADDAQYGCFALFVAMLVVVLWLCWAAWFSYGEEL